MKLKPETRNLSKIPQKAGKPKNSVDLRQSQLSLTPAKRDLQLALRTRFSILE